MKYTVCRGFCLSTGQDVYPGDEVEITDKEEARVLLERGSIQLPSTAQQGPQQPEASAPESPQPDATEKQSRSKSK